MRPLYQSLLTALAVCCAVALFFTWRWSMAAGVFNTLPQVSPGACRVIANLQGPEDFEIDAAHNLLFVSSSNRRHPGPGDGIYAVRLDEANGSPLRLAGTPADFHPHGISLYHAPGGGDALTVVDHKASGFQTVEIFTISYDGATPRLTPQSAIGGGLLVSPNDVFAVAPDHFYVTNDHVTKSAFGRFAEDYLLWAHSDLVYFNGSYLKIAVQRIAFPNGVLVSPDGRHLYVTATNERRLIAFSREDFTGNLEEIGSLSLPARLDNITMDAAGDLIIAGHPSLLKVNAFRADARLPSPSAVFRVHLDAKGAPQSYDTIYANDGHEIGASSSAAVWNGHLIIGSVLDDKVLECPMK